MPLLTAAADEITRPANFTASVNPQNRSSVCSKFTVSWTTWQLIIKNYGPGSQEQLDVEHAHSHSCKSSGCFWHGDVNTTGSNPYGDGPSDTYGLCTSEPLADKSSGKSIKCVDYSVLSKEWATISGAESTLKKRKDCISLGCTWQESSDIGARCSRIIIPDKDTANSDTSSATNNPWKVCDQYSVVSTSWDWATSKLGLKSQTDHEKCVAAGCIWQASRVSATCSPISSSQTEESTAAICSQYSIYSTTWESVRSEFAEKREDECSSDPAGCVWKVNKKTGADCNPKLNQTQNDDSTVSKKDDFSEKDCDSHSSDWSVWASLFTSQEKECIKHGCVWKNNGFFRGSECVAPQMVEKKVENNDKGEQKEENNTRDDTKRTQIDTPDLPPCPPNMFRDPQNQNSKKNPCQETVQYREDIETRDMEAVETSLFIFIFLMALAIWLTLAALGKCSSPCFSQNSEYDSYERHFDDSNSRRRDYVERLTSQRNNGSSSFIESKKKGIFTTLLNKLGFGQSNTQQDNQYTSTRRFSSNTNRRNEWGEVGAHATSRRLMEDNKSTRNVQQNIQLQEQQRQASFQMNSAKEAAVAAVAADHAGNYKKAIEMYEITIKDYASALESLPTTEETWLVATQTLAQYEKRVKDLKAMGEEVDVEVEI